jgi:hypothetical protein
MLPAFSGSLQPELGVLFLGVLGLLARRQLRATMLIVKL